jgi:hypothetical protein
MSVERVLNKCCMSVEGVLNKCCMSVEGVLNKCCMSVEGVLNKCCMSVEGVLNNCCTSVEGVLNKCCMSVEGVLNKCSVGLKHESEGVGIMSSDYRVNLVRKMCSNISILTLPAHALFLCTPAQISSSVATCIGARLMLLYCPYFHPPYAITMTKYEDELVLQENLSEYIL